MSTPVGYSARRRGAVLFAVLLVVAVAALAGATAIAMSDAQVESAWTTVRRTQARALAWSGVQAAMAELASQRAGLLDGSAPTVTTEWTVYTDEAGTQGVFRIVAVDGADVASESGKLDVNAATPDMLGKLPAVGKALAAKVVAAREQRPFTSVEDLLRVEGVTPEMLYGDALLVGGERSAGSEPDAGLGGVLTAFSFDPNVQAGLGPDGPDHRGELRINLNAEWSETLGRAIEARLGADAAKAVEAFMKAGETFGAPSAIVKKMRGMNVPPEQWGPILDVFTNTDDPYLLGRVDLNTAPEGVLACVPGFDASAAAELVSAREQVDGESRRNPAWPVLEGILTPEQFELAVDHVTTRSLQWRVRVEAGVVRAADVDGRGAWAEGDAAPLADRVVLEAVIDVSSERARVAYLRDVTALDIARRLYAELPAPEVAPDEPGPDEGASADDPPGDGAEAAPDAEAGDTGAEEDAPPRDIPPDDADMESDEPEMSSPSDAPDDGAESGETSPEAEAAPDAPPAGGVDNRTGRWTTGPKGGGR